MKTPPEYIKHLYVVKQNYFCTAEYRCIIFSKLNNTPCSDSAHINLYITSENSFIIYISGPFPCLPCVSVALHLLLRGPVPVS